MDTPVALLVFNRLDKTREVLRALRRVRPRRLLVVADGPRPDREGEQAMSEAVRATIEEIDWDCTIERNYSEVNLGCRRRVSSGIDWVFSRVDRAIILEDDCVPDPTFFRFAEELLERYGSDERVMSISGTNFHRRRTIGGPSYHFSAYPQIWGWATWRRAWRHYDVSMRQWPEVRTSFQDLGDGLSEPYFRTIFDDTYAGRIDTWDYQWMFASWLNGGLSIIPETNLVTNIGFGAGATHTHGDSELADRPTRPMRFPLRHPQRVARNMIADQRTYQRVFQPIPPLRSRIALAVRRGLASFLGRRNGAGAAFGG